MSNKSINIELPEKLWKKVEIQAAKETINTGEKVNKREIVIKALEKYLSEGGEL